MRGIPSSFILFFFAFVFLIELVSYLGIRHIIARSSVRKKFFVTILFLITSILATGLLFYSFSNPEIIRQSRDYSLFYIVVIISVINLVPKFCFSLLSLLSYFVRFFTGYRGQSLMLTGSLLVTLSVFLVIFSGIFFGRYQINVQKQNLYFENLPSQLEGYKIVQISDIHLGSFGKDSRVLKKTVAVIESFTPDLLLFTGDIVNNFGDEIDGFEPYLAQMQAKDGKYAILGNHDYGDYYQWPDSVDKRKNLEEIKNGLSNNGFQLLLNKWKQVAVKDTSYALIGVENWGHKPFPQYANLEKAMEGVPSNSFKILMSHDPAHWDAIVVPQTDIPLTLSGHTHGGQFGIKIAGIEFSPIYFIQKYWGGLYWSDNQYLYVNRGLGTIGFSGRVEMNPEITLLTLHQAKIH